MSLRADCHVHIIAPEEFPYADGQGYKPRSDEVGDFAAFTHTLEIYGITHALLVQPSCYGYDNRALLDALTRSRGRFKGIAAIPVETSVEEMRALQDKGIVGIRVNLAQSDPGALGRSGMEAFLERVRTLDWFLEVYAVADAWEGVVPALRTAGVRLLIDHFGDPDPSRGIGQPGFQSLLGLVRETDAVVKLSAPFRASRRPYPHEDIEPFVAAILDTFGLDRCLWGSDWPFINTSQGVEYEALLRLAERWLPDSADRKRLFWENPVRLFGFLS